MFFSPENEIWVLFLFIYFITFLTKKNIGSAGSAICNPQFGNTRFGLPKKIFTKTFHTTYSIFHGGQISAELNR